MTKQGLLKGGMLIAALLLGIGLSWWAVPRFFPGVTDSLVDLTQPYTYQFQTDWMKQEATVVYPAAARRQSIEGSVILSMMVQADGTIGESKVLRSSGHTLLDDAAIKASHDFVVDTEKAGATTFPFEKKLKLTFRLEDAAPAP